MFYLSIKTNAITDEKIELIHKQKYIQASKELFELLINADTVKLNETIQALDYERLNLDILNKNSHVIYENQVSFGSIKIYKKEDSYFLYMSYLDDEVLYFDTSQKEELKQKNLLNSLIAVDIVVLFIMLFIILKMLFPLKILSQGIQKFGSGDYTYRLKKLSNNDEISQMVDRFNTMAENLERLIVSRSQFLSDISHELRTPISKSKLALEMMEEGKYKEILKKSIVQIDELTNEILELEKLNSNNLQLEFKEYNIETILAQVFSKMIIEDDEIQVDIQESFYCIADLNYLAIAIKNLIENGLKYKQSGKVEIVIRNNSIEVSNTGEKLQHDLEFYTRTFTQEDSSRSKSGYGLGLNIVKRVLEYHNFTLEYNYKKPMNIFKIVFATHSL
jgi:two-component system OmpR family sensor kinase